VFLGHSSLIFLQISKFLDNYNVFVAILLEKYKRLLSIFEIPNTNYEISYQKSR